MNSQIVGENPLEHPSRQTTLFQRCFKVDLGRDVEQPIFNVKTTLLISTSGKRPIFNVVSTSDFNIETTSNFNVEQRQIPTLKQRQRHVSILIRYNKIECLFNVEVRRCFSLYLPAGIQ